MIRALRDRHRILATTLVVLLPPLFLASLPVGRPSVDRHGALPDGAGLSPVGPPVVLLAEPRIMGRLLAHPGESRSGAILVTPARDPAIPDLLAYWSPATADSQALPQQAILLGALRGSREQLLILPEPGRMRGGRVVLYSHGWSRVLSAVPLPGLP
jgi:hypothetical protein